MTFQTFLPECEKGDPESWQVFLARYTPIVFRLLEVHAQPVAVGGGKESVWQDALKVLAADGFQRLREFDHQAEREFLIDLKWFVLDVARQRLDSPAGDTRYSAESVLSRLQGRPIAHQEIILLNLGGYTPAALEKVLGVPMSLIEKALAPAAGPGPAQHAADSAQAAAAWLEFLHEVHAARTPDCTPRRLWVRILDGQISWYDKTPAENHMIGCLHCIETWASLREADYLRRDTPALEDSAVSAYLAVLPLASPATRGSWVGKLFGR